MSIDFSKFTSGKGKKKKRFRFGYNYEDIAKLTGYKVGTIKVKVKKGEFNPRNLESTVRFLAAHILLQESKQEGVVANK